MMLSQCSSLRTGLHVAVDTPAPSHTLAIAAPRFHLPSETFIRDHVRVLAPGRTVLLGQDGHNSELLGCPSLFNINTHANSARSLKWLVAKGKALWGLVGCSGLQGAGRERVIAFLKAQDVRAVLAEYGPMGVQLMGACHAAGVPLYVHFHGYDAMLPKQRWYVARQYRQLFKLAAGIIAPSVFLANEIRKAGCPSAKLYVSYNGIDPGRFPASRRDPGRCVAVGRLVTKKAPHLTIQAFARVRARCPHARLDIIGDGELRESCQTLVHELGLTDSVTLHGARPHHEVSALLARASLFVQHSMKAKNRDIEGFPVSILEAMAAALPVVSTRHSGIPEAVEENQTGILVDEGDVDGMAHAMTALLEDPKRAAAMGCAGYRRVVARFTHERMRRRLLGIMNLTSKATEQAAA